MAVLEFQERRDGSRPFRAFLSKSLMSLDHNTWSFITIALAKLRWKTTVTRSRTTYRARITSRDPLVSPIFDPPKHPQPGQCWNHVSVYQRSLVLRMLLPLSALLRAQAINAF